jgi:hypothetical protein
MTEFPTQEDPDLVTIQYRNPMYPRIDRVTAPYMVVDAIAL